MVKWQDIKNYLIGSSVGIVVLFSSLFLLTGVDYTFTGDISCGETCESYINVTTKYWRICFDSYNGTKYENETLFKKQTRSRTLHVNLDKVDNIIQTEPEVKVDWLVPTYGGNWRPIENGDCWERGKVNKIKLVGHKEKEQDVKWSFVLGNKVDIDPLWEGIGNWTIEDDLVYFEDTRAYLSAEPHTLSSSDWVYFNLTSKIFTGEIDAVWGFDSDSAKPTRAELYKPHWVNWTTDHSQTFLDVSFFPLTEKSCDYGNDYNLIHRNITYQICGEWNYTDMESECLYYNTTSSVVCYDSLNISNTPNYTVYWQTKHSRLENWLDISNKFDKVNYDYDGFDTWYRLKNISINQNQNYQVRTWVDVPISLRETSGKYVWGIKKTDDTIQEAIDNDRLYLLDPWFNSSWTYKKDITIDYTKVNGSQANFPVLINTTDTDLRDEAQADGDDIVFTDSDGDKLAHEIEFFNSTTGWLVAWVGIPTLSNTTNTTISMYYGNAGASNQQNASGVWDDNFVMVQHMQEDPGPGGAGEIVDSTKYNNDGTAEVSMTSDDQVAGQIDGSLDFDGGDDYVEINSSPLSSLPANKFAYSGWIKIDDFSGGDRVFVSGALILADNPKWNIHIRQTTGKLNFWAHTLSPAFYYNRWISDAAFIVGQFYHIAINIDYTTPADQLVTVFVNGQEISGSWTDTGTVNINFSNEKYLGIGIDKATGADWFDGLIDEVRISNVARSAGWIATEYNNQFSPDSFYSVGEEETEPAVDSCTPPGSGTWNVNASDYCNWTTNLTVPGDLICSETGTVILTANMTFNSSNQRLIICPSCDFRICSGGSINK